MINKLVANFNKSGKLESENGISFGHIAFLKKAHNVSSSVTTGHMRCLSQDIPALWNFYVSPVGEGGERRYNCKTTEQEIIFTSERALILI